MKKTKICISLFIFVFVFATLVNTASAGINVTDAEATYEADLSSVSVPTNPVPIETIFTCNEEAISEQDLFNVSIPTVPSPLKESFIANEEAAFDTNLYAVTISTVPSPVKEIFIINEEVKTYEDLNFPIGLLKDTTSPTITNVTVTSITSGSATITWNTDEIADSLVKYGKVSGTYTERKEDTWFVTNHTVVLTGLSQDTKYYFIVNSTDRDRNTNEITGDPFTTLTGVDKTPPYTSGHNPAKDAVNVAVDTNIVVHVQDDDSGVNSSTIVMTVEGVVVTPNITGTSADYTLTYDPPVDFDYGQVVNVTVDASDLAGNPMIQDAYSFAIADGLQYFDTGEGAYPSIMGTHEGEIKTLCDINVSRLYTYPCEGTGGHTEFLRIHGNGLNESASWDSYSGNWQYLYFNDSFVLEAGKNYNYTIITGSYPQIHHTDNLSISTGFITCSEFVDVNGKKYNNWIPAIKLFP